MIERRRLSGAELRVRLASLGLTASAAAVAFGVEDQAVRAWQSEQRPIPDHIESALLMLEEVTREEVQAVAMGILETRDHVIVIGSFPHRVGLAAWATIEWFSACRWACPAVGAGPPDRE